MYFGGSVLYLYVCKGVQVMAEENILEQADKIMDNAVEVAGQLLCDKPQIAEVVLKQLLKCDPEHLTGLQLLGLCKHRMGQNAEAIEIIQTALELDPTCADNWNNIGLAYGALDDHARAIECIEKAAELKPSQYLFYNNLALQYRGINQHERAIECLQKALSVEEVPQILLNLGGMYGETKDYDKSQECFERALEINPNYAASHVDLAMLYHLKGDLENGFREYEWRFIYFPQLNFYKKVFDQNKLWDGKASIEGKRFLIYGEQGLGDAVQFIRYVAELKQREPSSITIHCPESLNSVLGQCEGVDGVVNRDIINNTGNEFPEYDCVEDGDDHSFSTVRSGKRTRQTITVPSLLQDLRRSSSSR